MLPHFSRTCKTLFCVGNSRFFSLFSLLFNQYASKLKTHRMKQTDKINCPRCKGSGKIPNPETIGAELLKLRTDAGLSREAVRREMKVSGVYLFDVENGAKGITTERVKQYKAAVKKLAKKGAK